MSNPVLLNNVAHKNLCVITTRGARYGDNVMLAVTFPSEFRNLQAHYPIVFRKGGDGISFEAVALFGFQEGENLFLGKDGWEFFTDFFVLPRIRKHSALQAVQKQKHIPNLYIWVFSSSCQPAEVSAARCG